MRDRTSRRWLVPTLVVALVVTVAVAAGSSPGAYQTSITPGSLSFQMSEQGNTLIVADNARQSLAIYRVDEGDVRLLSVRSLDRDFDMEAANDRPNATLPSVDFPGQDPPEFSRPHNAVRTASQFEGQPRGNELWNATYLVPGSTAEVFGALRKSFKGWKLTSEISSSTSRSQFRVVKDGAWVELSVSAIPEDPAHVQVQVSEGRERS